MSEHPADLDVVVLGGGGHVGLPLSLAFATAGLRVGIYDTNQATLDRIAAGEMPFLEPARTSSSRAAADRPAGVRRGRRDDRSDDVPHRRHRHARRRVPRPFRAIREGRRPVAPHLRDGPLLVLRSTVYPGTTGDVAQHLARAGLQRRRRLLPGARRRGRGARGDRRAAADRLGRDAEPPPSAPRTSSRRSSRRRSGPRPRRPSWPSSSPTPGATSSSPSPTSST